MHRRVDERVRLRATGEIVHAGRTFDCVLRDVSRRGARLRVTDAGAIPPQFELLIKESSETRPARVRWRNKIEIGIEFLPERRAFGRRQPAKVAELPKIIPD